MSPNSCQWFDHTGLSKQRVDVVGGTRIWINGHSVINFASANYLGLNQHPQVVGALSCAARTWGISLGMPRAFATDRLTDQLELAIAKLVHQERALIFPSTSHIANDVLPLLGGPKGVLFIDQKAYPISVRGAQAAALWGARIHLLPHNDHQRLARMLERYADVRNKVVVCDGVYPGTGRTASLREMARTARMFDAIVYVDDAHGIGVFGANPTQQMPYGHGGGGTPRYLNIKPGNLVHVGSLSKSFGVPVAFVAGPATLIDFIRNTAATFSECTPPAVPVVAAAMEALRIHAMQGEALRRQLARNVRRFRRGLVKAGRTLLGNHLFPIQSLDLGSCKVALAFGRDLLKMGIWPIGQPSPHDRANTRTLQFAISALHKQSDIDEALTAISHLCRPTVIPHPSHTNICDSTHPTGCVCRSSRNTLKKCAAARTQRSSIKLDNVVDLGR